MGTLKTKVQKGNISVYHHHHNLIQVTGGPVRSKWRNGKPHTQMQPLYKKKLAFWRRVDPYLTWANVILGNKYPHPTITTQLVFPYYIRNTAT